MSEPFESKRTALAATAVFSSLTDRQLDEIARVSDERHVASGELVCRQHEYGTDAFVIIEGQAAVLHAGVEVAACGPGELVGDWAMFRNGRRSATVRAVTPLRVVVVDPSEIDSALAATPSAAHAVGPSVR
jgi:CRP-like cAMP-binding protein